MNLKVLLLDQPFVQKSEVRRIVVETTDGSMGLLPMRLDCVAALVPGILVYETAAEGEVLVAIDGGVLVKTGADVRISVHRAIGGSDLGQLHAAVEQEFKVTDAAAQGAGSAMMKLEAELMHRLGSFHNE